MVKTLLPLLSGRTVSLGDKRSISFSSSYIQYSYSGSKGNIVLKMNHSSLARSMGVLFASMDSILADSYSSVYSSLLSSIASILSTPLSEDGDKTLSSFLEVLLLRFYSGEDGDAYSGELLSDKEKTLEASFGRRLIVCLLPSFSSFVDLLLGRTSFSSFTGCLGETEDSSLVFQNPLFQVTEGEALLCSLFQKCGIEAVTLLFPDDFSLLSFLNLATDGWKVVLGEDIDFCTSSLLSLILLGNGSSFLGILTDKKIKAVLSKAGDVLDILGLDKNIPDDQGEIGPLPLE